MISRTISKKLNALPQPLFHILDSKNAHTLTAAKGQRHRAAGGRRTSPRVFDALSHDSGNRTSRTSAAHDAHLQESIASTPSDKDTSATGVLVTNNSPSSSGSTVSHAARKPQDTYSDNHSDGAWRPISPKAPGIIRRKSTLRAITRDKTWAGVKSPLRSPAPYSSHSLQTRPRAPTSIPLQLSGDELEEQHSVRKSLYRMKRPETTSEDRFTPASPVGYCWENRVVHKHKDIYLLRQKVKNKVQLSIRNAFGTNYRVEFFGSLRYHVSYRTSDLDMVILDNERRSGFEELNLESKVPIYNVRKLANALRRVGFVDIETRPWATVPIVKFRDPESNLECDINVNDRLGLINSEMIKRYCCMYPVLRPLLYEVKEWGKPLGLNSPSGAKGMSMSFSSYAFALMTIGFLQDKYHLPSLQQNLPEETSPIIRFTRKPHRGWDIRYHQEGIPWVPPVTAHVKDVLKEWARYWTTFPHDTHAMDIRVGGAVKKSDDATGSPICVMDPFITTKNVTNGISKAVFHRFIEECERMAMPQPVKRVVNGSEHGVNTYN